MDKVGERHKKKIAQIRQEEHDRQMANWFEDAIGIHGGDCQD